ncbi:hypothetical protein OBE_07912 [human gut metagenome]|uniref:Uncharacterized protein n=1 Tax=human gut metagenome TaxID=408170 RepID=K1SY58_9ZZZZ
MLVFFTVSVGYCALKFFRRYNIRTNADVKAAKWLKVGTNTMAAYEEAQQADDGS